MENNPCESLTASGNIDRTTGCSDKRKKLRRILLFCLYLLAAIAGATGADRSQAVVVQIVFPFMMASAAAYWCVVDSRILGRPIVPAVQCIMFFTWPLAVPIYLVYSRRLRGLGLGVLHAMGLFIVAAVAFHAAGYLAFGKLWFERLGH